MSIREEIELHSLLVTFMKITMEAQITYTLRFIRVVFCYYLGCKVQSMCAFNRTFHFNFISFPA